MMKVKNTFKTENILYFFAISFLMFILVLTAPGLNNEIYAKSAKVPVKVELQGVGMFGSLSETKKQIREVYEHISKLDIYHANHSYAGEIGELQPSPTVADYFRPTFVTEGNGLANEGKMFEPRGQEKLLRINYSQGYGGNDLLTDPAVYCSGQGVPLASTGGNVAHLNQDNTLNRDVLNQILHNLNTNNENNQLLTNRSERYNIIYITLVEDYLNRNYRDLGNWRISGNSLIAIAKEGKEAEMTAALNEAKAYADTQVTRYLREATFGTTVLNPNIGEPSALNSNTVIRGPNSYFIGPYYEGVITTRDLDDPGVTPEAAFAVTELYQRLPNETHYTQVSNQNAVQAVLWTTREGQFAELNNYKGTFREVSEGKHKEFGKYWDEMLEFVRTRGLNTEPNQKIIHAVQRDKRLTFQYETPTRPPYEVVIRNPNIKYEPRFVEADGIKPEVEKQLIFSEETQEYKIGPYKLDYVEAMIDEETYVAAMTNAKVFGKYLDGIGPGHENMRETNEWREYNQRREERNNIEQEYKDNEEVLKENMSSLLRNINELANIANANSALVPHYNEFVNAYRKLHEIRNRIKEGEYSKEEPEDFEADLNEALNSVNSINKEDFNQILNDIIENEQNEENKAKIQELSNQIFENFEASVKQITKQKELESKLLEAKRLQNEAKEAYQKKFDEEERKRKEEEAKKEAERLESIGTVNGKNYQNEPKNLTPTVDDSQRQYVGEFTITHYCNCTICCEEYSGGPTASGVMPREGVTIAADTSVLPMGTQVQIDGYSSIFTVQDVGGAIKGNKIDVYVSSHQKALQMGVKTNVKVYRVIDAPVADATETIKIDAKKTELMIDRASDEHKNFNEVYQKIKNAKLGYKGLTIKDVERAAKNKTLLHNTTLGADATRFKNTFNKYIGIYKRGNDPNINKMMDAIAGIKSTSTTPTQQPKSNNEKRKEDITPTITREILYRKLRNLGDNGNVYGYTKRELVNAVKTGNKIREARKYSTESQEFYIQFNGLLGSDAGRKALAENLGVDLSQNNEQPTQERQTSENTQIRNQPSQNTQTNNEQQQLNQQEQQTRSEPATQTSQSNDPIFLTPDEVENDFDIALDITDPEVPGWRFQVNDRIDDTNGEGIYIPRPDETFYIVIPYDQNLAGISAIAIEFTHMIYSGRVEIYEGGHTVRNNLSDVTEVEADIEQTENGATLNLESVEYELQGERNRQKSQPLAYYTAARWYTKTILVLHSDVTDTPEEEVTTTPELLPTTNLITNTPTTTGGGDEPGEYLNRFYVPIGGYVWKDNLQGDKHWDRNHIYDEGDDRLKGIKVNVYRIIGEKDDGHGIKNVLDKTKARLFYPDTVEQYEGEVFTNENGDWGPYDIRDIGFSENEKESFNPETHRIVFEVEYVYDGIEYEPVIPLVEMGANTADNAKSFMNMQDPEQLSEYFDNSMAFENYNERTDYNIRHAEIAGLTRMNAEGETTGLANEVTMEGDRTGISTELEYRKDEEAQTDRVASRYQTITPEDYPELIDSGRFMTASTLNIGLAYMFTEDMTSEETILIPPGGEQREGQWFKTVKPYMTNINFGLMEREKPNVAISKDLASALVVVNKKAFEYKYDAAYELGINSGNVEEWLTQNLTLESDLQYKLDLYKTDYIFRTEIYKADQDNHIFEAINAEQNIERTLDDQEHEAYTEDTRKVDIFLTYKISVYNASTDETIYVTQLNDYYDNRMTPVIENPITKMVEKDPEIREAVTGEVISGPAQISAEENTGKIDILTPKYKVYDSAFEQPEFIDFNDPGFKDFKWVHKNSTNTNENQPYNVLESDDFEADPMNPEFLIKAGGRADIYTTYRLRRDHEEYGLRNSVQLGKFANIAEIAGFASYDPTTGEVQAKVDVNSAPDNADILRIMEKDMWDIDKLDFEDDTDGAPIIDVRVDEDGLSRKLTGMVWEDFRNTFNAGIRTGNGIKDEGELPIKGQTMVLEERISVKRDKVNIPKFIDEQDEEIELANEGEYIDLPFIWPQKVDTGDGFINIFEETNGFTPIAETNEEGKYYYEGIPAGNFVVKMRYSATDNPDNLVKTVRTDKDPQNRIPHYYNGIDFKSTLFYGGENDKVDTTWLSKLIGDEQKQSGNHFSFIRDDEYKRVELSKKFKNWSTTQTEMMRVYDREFGGTDLEKELLKKAHKETNMVAVTPKINFSIEYYEKLPENDSRNLLSMYERAFAINGVTQNIEEQVAPVYDVQGINASIVERPKNKLVLNKEISEIKFLSTDGTPRMIAYFKSEPELIPPEIDPQTYVQQMYTIRFKNMIDEERENKDIEGHLIFNDNIYGIDGIINGEDANAEYNQGYAYLQIDEQILQGSEVKVKYKINAYNLSEMDRKFDLETEIPAGERGYNYYMGEAVENQGYLYHQSNPDYIWGKYIGEEYYTKKDGELTFEDTAKANINGILDILAPALTLDSNHPEYNKWVKMNKSNLVGVLKGVTAENAMDKEYYDIRNGLRRDYITDTSSTVYGYFPYSSIQLIPVEQYIRLNGIMPDFINPTAFEQSEDTNNWYETWEIGATAYTGSLLDSGDQIFENTAELVQYEIDNARRDIGADPGSIFYDLELATNKKIFNVASSQYDAATSEYITVTPPTGLPEPKEVNNNVLKVAIGTFTILSITVGIIARKDLIKESKKDEYWLNNIR